MVRMGAVRDWAHSIPAHRTRHVERALVSEQTRSSRRHPRIEVVLVVPREVCTDAVSPLSQEDPCAPRERATSLKVPRRSVFIDRNSGNSTKKPKKTDRHETGASCDKCEYHDNGRMRQSAHRIRPFCDVQCDAESNVNIKAPAAGIGRIVTTGGGPLLCATLVGLEGSQGADSPC
jgi:hypothetical protein